MLHLVFACLALFRGEFFGWFAVPRFESGGGGEVPASGLAAKRRKKRKKAGEAACELSHGFAGWS